MNPSVGGWIDKFFLEQSPLDLPVIEYAPTFYEELQQTGFMYGHVVHITTEKLIDIKGWTTEEVTKVSLLHVLYRMYGLQTHLADPTLFIKSCVQFYKSLTPEGLGILEKVMPSNDTSYHLEKIIHERVQTNENIISKNFSHILTNALLYIDVLAYRQFLQGDLQPINYTKKLEEHIIIIINAALKSKTQKSEYDELVLKLMSASIRYTKNGNHLTEDLGLLPWENYNSILEKKYILDMVCLAFWNNSQSVPNIDELDFINLIIKKLQLTWDDYEKSRAAVAVFFTEYQNQIPYINYSNPVKHFYDQASQNVMLLITRNKNRLLKELSESGELVVLLAHSTRRDLDASEKRKVKRQLLDICKTVPSLTLFLLPGGSLLLPLLIKFIPKLLPSAFNENLE